MLDDSAFARFGPNAKMAPPLRSHADVEALHAALADGIIDVIATDHAPHDRASKHLDRLAPLFPGTRAANLSPADDEAQRLSTEDAELLASAANGIIGLETALGLALELVHHGLIDPSRMVTLMSLNPARLLRLDAQGTLAPGAQADITVMSDYEWTVELAKSISMSRNTPFTGKRLKGRAAYTILSGEIIHPSAPLRTA
jgi:dihydroorotase